MIKKIFLTLLSIIFLFSQAYAFNPLTVCSGVPATSGTSCSGDIGNTTPMSSGYGPGAGIIFVERVALACSGSNPTASAYIKYLDATDREGILVAYTDNSGEPDVRIGVTSATYDSGNTATEEWVSFGELTGTFAEADYVFIGFQFENNITKRGHETTGGTSFSRTGTFGTIPATWDTDTDSTSTVTINVKLNF